METIVGSNTGISYTATSLEDVAQFMDHLARNSAMLAEHAALKKTKRYEQGQSDAYKHVADVLRRTTLAEVKPTTEQAAGPEVRS